MSVNYSRTKTGIYNAVLPTLQNGDFAETQVDVNGRLITSTVVTANFSAAQEVIISANDDSVKIGDGAGHFMAVNADGSINVLGTSTVTGTVNANINGLASFQTSQYTVGTSAVQITPTPLTGRSSLSLKATTTGGGVIYVGNSSGVTTSTGYPLFSGDSIQLDLTTAHSIYAIASVAGQTVYALEIG